MGNGVKMRENDTVTSCHGVKVAFIGGTDKRATAKESPWVLVWVKARASDHVALLQGKTPTPAQAGQPGSELTRRGPGPGSPQETPVWGLTQDPCRHLDSGCCGEGTAAPGKVSGSPAPL